VSLEVAPIHRRALLINGGLVLLLLGFVIVAGINILHLADYALKQQAQAQQLTLQLNQSRAAYLTTRRNFQRSFDSSQKTVILRERYGLVHPQDLQVQWEK
jgi:hypothetical protein